MSKDASSNRPSEGQTKKSKRDRRHCAYCGGPSTTYDHVPPKGLFGDLLLTDHSINLDTVPSCNACNHPESADDAYFRDVMAVQAATIDTGIPAAVRDAIKRSLASAGQDFQTPFRILARGARPVWSSLGDSPLLHRAHAVFVRWDRIRRTVERTIRGLYWAHTGRRVPEEFDITIVGDKERERHGLVEAALFHEIAKDCARGSRRIVHRDVFMYGVAFPPDDERMSAWILCFYSKVLFLGLVGPPEERSPIVLP